MPSSFKNTLKQSLQHAFAWVFVLLALILVLTDIFKFTTTDFKEAHNWAFKTPDKIVGSSPRPLPPNTKTEIRKYSEFVTVSHPTLGFKITTGIRFDNSTDQNIESQWCYAAPTAEQKDGLFTRLTLRETNEFRAKKYAPYSVQTLRKFNLTQKQAKGLISFCRFKAS